MTLHPKRILVVDADRRFALELCAALKSAGFTALSPAPTAFYAMLLLGTRKVDAVVLDARLDGDAASDFVASLERTETAIVYVGPDRQKGGRKIGHLDAPREARRIIAALDTLLSFAPADRPEAFQNERVVVAFPKNDDQTRMLRAISRSLRPDAAGNTAGSVEPRRPVSGRGIVETP